MVQIDINELVDFIFKESLNEGLALTHKEIFTVVMLSQEYVERKLTQTIAEVEADE